MTLNVYVQDFAADCVLNGVQRRAARVMLIADSEAGQIRYDAVVNFFPYTDAEDFRITSDGYFAKTVYEASGRRSKKREAAFLQQIREICDALAAEAGGTVFWEQPLNAPRNA